jgi:pyruvate/2-oxoglutarate dehydrogenase complex dihydrolipoamide dehydrogenase (E3) component
VIGAGSAGLVTSYIAAAVKAKVTLIEKHKMGGDCLNTGCVPSKALIRTAKLLSHIRARRSSACTRRARIRLRRGDGACPARREGDRAARFVERYSKLGVECVEGTAKITSPWTVDVRWATAPGAPSPPRTS